MLSSRYTRILKYSEQYIWDHLSSTKVRIPICSECDAVFNFSCIASSNLAQSFTFSFTFFIIRIRLWIFKNSQLVLCMLLKYCSLKFDCSLNANWLEIFCWYLTFSESQQIESCLDHQYSDSVSRKNLALHWRQNSWPGTTLIFFGF